MPHITEEIWQTLTRKNNEFIALQAYPTSDLNYIKEEDKKLDFENRTFEIRN